jgi:hypothetical protein
MAFEQRNGSGALFKNTKKEAGSKQPDYTGNALSPSGEYFELSAWIKEGKNGKFMSVALQPKFGSEQKAAPKPSHVTGFEDFDSDCPF